MNGDQSVRATTITPLGDAFGTLLLLDDVRNLLHLDLKPLHSIHLVFVGSDLNNYNELVQISQKLPDLF